MFYVFLKLCVGYIYVCIQFAMFTYVTGTTSNVRYLTIFFPTLSQINYSPLALHSPLTISVEISIGLRLQLPSGRIMYCVSMDLLLICKK